jgi:GNAT superfamily N-acetyltransferase
MILRPATEADTPGILALLAEHIAHGDPARKWEWLYTGNPEGHALTWLAIDEVSGELAGLTSYFPLRLWLEGQVVRAAIGGDGYVRPGFRRRGIAARLHGALRADMPKNRIEVMFGAPAAANVTPLKTGGSRVIGETVRYFKPLRASALSGRAAFADPIARRLLIPRAGGARLEPMREGDRRVDEVWAASRDPLGIAVVHDAAHYGWRYLKAPAQVQHPFVIVADGVAIGVCALQRRGARLLIIDLVAPAGSWGEALAAIAHSAADLEGLEIVRLRQDGSRHHLWRHGFVAREASAFLIVTPEGSRYETLLRDPTRWTYTYGDLDIDRF